MSAGIATDECQDDRSLVAERPSDGPLLDVVGAATTVPLLDGSWVTYANLDAAASAPSLTSVADRVQEVLPLYASVHRGAGYLSQVSTALYEASRRTIGAFVGARTDDVVILTKHTTDSLNLLASAVPANEDGTPGRVLVLDLEHHANLLPWAHSPRAEGTTVDQTSTDGTHHAERATILVTAPTVHETLAALEAELAARSYALVAVTGASNVTGEALPLADVVRVAHGAGARVSLDGAQLLPHRSFSLEESGVDYVSFSGHKLYAPFGAGALVGRRDWLDVAAPHLAGGGAVREVTASDVAWASAPARHEAGSPNVIGAAALAAACETLAALPEGALAAHETTLRARLVEGLEAIDGITVVRIWEDSTDPVGVVTFTVADHDPGLVATYVSAEHGIGVRDGRFCAHPLIARLGIGPGAIRASISAATTASDVDRLLHALRTYLTQGTSARYEIADGCWAVAQDPRPTPAVASALGLTPTAWAGLAGTASACVTPVDAV